MNSRHGNTPIPIPDLVTHPSQIGRLSLQTRKAIAALRDRKIITKGIAPLPVIPKVDFQVYNIKADGLGEFTCNVWPGHLLQINPKYGATDPMKYWLAPQLDYTPPADPTAFTVSATKMIFLKVETTAQDIPTAVSVVVLSSEPTMIHAEPNPSAVENGGSAPPPRTGEYYYKIADFKVDPNNASMIVVDRQYHLGGPIIHRPTLQDWFNIPATLTDATRYPIAKQWNSAEARHELRSIAQIDSADSGVPIIEPLPSGPPTYPDSIRFRNLRHRVTGDDASTATQQIEVKESADEKDIVVLGNQKVANFTVTPYGGSPTALFGWDDGLVTAAADANLDMPPVGITETIEILDGCGTVSHVLEFTLGILTDYDQVAV